jgi:aldehyde dehydrogenase (NAD+)
LLSQFSGFNRAQILYYIAENLELRKSEFGQRILNLTGKSIELSNSEVEKSIQRLFYWASFADKVTKAEMSLPFFKLKLF